MSINLVELGIDIGEAQATADAALEIAIADGIEETIGDALDESGEHGCGEDCPCRSENRELRAALEALSTNYHEDMQLVLEVLDEVLQIEEEEAPAPADEEAVEPVHVEEPSEEETHDTDSDTATDQSSGEGHTAAGRGGNGRQAETHTAHTKHLRFTRGRR